MLSVFSEAVEDLTIRDNIDKPVPIPISEIHIGIVAGTVEADPRERAKSRVELNPDAARAELDTAKSSAPSIVPQWSLG